MDPTSCTRSLVLDFDGTITPIDVGDAICDRFAPPAWREIDEQWLRGEISLPEAQRRMWGMTRATRDEMCEYARVVGALRPGLAALLAAARQRGYVVVVASGGFDFYVDALMAGLAANIDEVHCNSATWQGDRMTPVFHAADLACAACAVCKARVCERERQRGAARVMFVGDGSSDRCVLGCASLGREGSAADIIAVVTGSSLEEACVRARAPHAAFSDFAALVPLL